MFSLVKNELIKISHKKGIYIYLGFLILVFGIAVFMTKFVGNNKVMGQFDNIIEENLSSYDLNNKEELEYYISDRTDLDLHKIMNDNGYTDTESLEYYYIDNEIRTVVYDLNKAKYEFKDEETVKAYQEKLDEMIKNISSLDWKKDLREQKEEYESSLDELSGNDKKAMEDRILAINYRLEHNIPVSYNEISSEIDRFESASATYYSVKDKEPSDYTEKKQKQTMEKDYFETKYELENDLLESSTKYTSVKETFNYFSMDIVVAMVIIMGGIIAEEFNKGTVKQLFVRPFSRAKILTSKLIASVIALLVFIILYIGLQVVSDTLMGANIKDLFSPVVVYNFNTSKVLEMNVLKYLGLTFLASLPEYLFYMAICLFVGVLSTNTVAAIVATFGIQIIPALISLPDKIAAFLPYNCLSFNVYLFGGLPANQYQNFTQSFIVMLISISLLFGLTYYVFKKKDVKNQ